MTVQQKLDLFTQRTMESVNRQCREATYEIQTAIKSAALEAEKIARREMEDRVKTESYRLEREANKKIHAVSMEARRDLFSLQTRLADELFADLEKDLREFTGTLAYKDFLLEGIAAVMDTTFLPERIAAAADKDFSIMQLMAKDIFYEELRKLIETETCFTIEVTEEDFIGGFRLISGDGRMMTDYTLLARLEKIKSQGLNLYRLKLENLC